jgi:O-antigen/teichoic acid export membrane protein
MYEIMTQDPVAVDAGMSRLANSTQQDIGILAAGAGTSLIGKMVGQGFYVLGGIVLARLLGPAVFGLYAIGLTMLRVAGTVCLLGLPQGVVRYGSRYQNSDPSRLRGLLLEAIGLVVLSGALTGGIFYIAAPWLAKQVFQKPDLLPVIRWFSPAFALYAGLRVTAAATTVSQETKYAVYSRDVGQPALNLFLAVGLSLLGLGLLGVVAANGVSYAITFALALVYLKRLFPEALSRQTRPTSVVRELLAFSLFASGAGAFTVLSTWATRLMVGAFLQAGDAGIYQAASQSSIVFPMIASALNVIFSAMIADLSRGRHVDRLDELYKISTKWGLYLSLPLLLAVCSMPRRFMVIAFGAGYESGWQTLVLLVVGQLVAAGVGAVGPLMTMTGHQRNWFAISGAALVTNLILGWVLIPRLGLIGAALSTTCTVACMSLVGLVQVRRFLGIWPYDRRYLKGLVAAASSVAVWVLLRTSVVDSLLLTLLLCGAAYGVVFPAVLLLQGLDAEDTEFLHSIGRRLRRPTRIAR